MIILFDVIKLYCKFADIRFTNITNCFMRKIRIAVVLLAFLGLMSCNKGVQERPDLGQALKEVKDTLSWTLLPGVDVVPIPRGLEVTDSLLVVLGKYNGTWLQLYNRSTGDSVASFLREGQGPGEVVKGDVMDLVDESSVSVFDYGRRLLNIVEIPTGTIVKSANINDIVPMAGAAWALSEDKALVKYAISRDEGMALRAYAIADLSTGEVVSEYHELPDVFAQNEMMLFSQPYLTISPDKKHFVSTTMVGGTMEIFENGEDGIKPVFSTIVYPTKYVDKGNVKLPDNPIYVFLYSCSSNDRFYVSYINSDDANGATKISVWDWEGNLLECYDTDRLIYKLAYDTATDTLYGVVEGEDGTAFAKLNL